MAGMGQSKDKSRRSQLMLLRKRNEHGQGNKPVLEGEAECTWGELTDIGRLSTLRLGKKLRELYVDKYVFQIAPA